MSEPTSPSFLPWLATVVGALWAALRASVAKNEARLEAALRASEAERERERREHRETVKALGAKLDAERDGRRNDNARSATALYRARLGSAPGEWEDECPTGVRDVLDITRRPRAGG